MLILWVILLILFAAIDRFYFSLPTPSKSLKRRATRRIASLLNETSVSASVRESCFEENPDVEVGQKVRDNISQNSQRDAEFTHHLQERSKQKRITSQPSLQFLEKPTVHSLPSTCPLIDEREAKSLDEKPSQDMVNVWPLRQGGVTIAENIVISAGKNDVKHHEENSVASHSGLNPSLDLTIKKDFANAANQFGESLQLTAQIKPQSQPETQGYSNKPTEPALNRPFLSRLTSRRASATASTNISTELDSKGEHRRKKRNSHSGVTMYDAFNKRLHDDFDTQEIPNNRRAQASRIISNESVDLAMRSRSLELKLIELLRQAKKMKDLCKLIVEQKEVQSKESDELLVQIMKVEEECRLMKRNV